MLILMGIFLLSMQYAASTGISDMGALLSGIGTILLALVGIGTFIWGTVTFSRWKKENQCKKVSDAAEIEFKTMNLIEQDILNWLKYSSFVFNSTSDANQKEYATLPSEKQKEFLNNCKTDDYELVNYSRRGNDIMNKIILAKKCATFFQNEDILGAYDELLKIVKKAINNLNILHFPDMDGVQKTEAMTALSFEPNQKRVSELCESIRDVLIKYVMFDM